ncbi:hypothetical protein [Massilia sp. S19_KUP03_FR1]|uniref:hypothetical protein n=1 Tax=Massilia sp. S19_KUP03_FR1 TaxID=3025503 RepID=UPI002FCD78A1
MYKVSPSAPSSHAPSPPSHAGNCAIFDARTLLYQPALRAVIIQEQVALLATRLAMARWTSANTVALPENGADAPPFRAAFYARQQDHFFAWIARGGVWDDDAAPAHTDAPSSSDLD